MDDLVKQAMLKWPDVPHCYGWLALDQRGQWWMRDSATQAAGAFPHSKGWLLEHAALIAFIGRNYQADELGQWYFQNGPQRVYVELENTPIVWHWQGYDAVGQGQVRPHYALADVAATSAPQACFLDEEGVVYLLCQQQLGVVYSQDVGAVADWLEQTNCQPEAVRREELPQRFGFVRSPEKAQQLAG